MEFEVTIVLSKKQRDLLLKYESSFMNKDLFRLISIGINQKNEYHINLNEEQLDELLNQVAMLSVNEPDQKKQEMLDDIQCGLEEVNLELYGDDFDDDDDCDSDDDDSYDDSDEEEFFGQATGELYLLKVALFGENKVWREIAICADQTLHALHDAIYSAFDRYDQHMYSFYFPASVKKSMDIRAIVKGADEYTHPFAFEEEQVYGKDVDDASIFTMADLELEKGQIFYYLFDFGDEWWHEIKVEKIGGQPDGGIYPRVTARKGESPEQYPDFEGEEDLEDEEEE